MRNSSPSDAAGGASRRRRQGVRSNAWGAEAERLAADAYRARGARLVLRRLRNQGGEIDLIMREGDVVVFVEVKARRSLEQALSATTPESWTRRGAAALAYADEIGHSGDVRLDLAAVDRNGQVLIVENAGMAAAF